MKDNDKTIDQIDQVKDKRRMRNKDKSAEKSAFDRVFDSYTLESVAKLRSQGVIDELVGIISAGKEANVYFAYGKDDRPIAVKIYKIDPQNTKWMKNYIIGDPRFKKIGNATHKIIYTWCRKEYKNLQQLRRHGLITPEPLAYRSNVLVMTYIGEDNGSPAKRLKDVEVLPNPQENFEYIIEQIKKMYIEAHLVHGDLSEYNILFHNNQQIIIDVSQAVSVYHINAPSFLKRDLINIRNFYLPLVEDKEEYDPDYIMREIFSQLD